MYCLRKTLLPPAIAIAICVVQFAMLWNAADELSPNPDEFAHVVAGISYWRTGETDLYNVNPPLVRLVAGLPCVLAGAAVPQLDVQLDRTTRREYEFGRQFISEHPQSAFAHLVSARRACLVFVVSGTVAVMMLGALLLNNLAGLAAGFIWAFNPLTLGYSLQVACDIPGASLGAWALLGSALLMEKTTIWNICFAGICLGLAIVTKSTWIMAAILWPVGFVAIWLYVRNIKTNERLAEFSKMKFAPLVGIISLVLLIALGVLHFAYCGQGTWVELGDYTFVSASLSDESPVRNRFRGTWAGSIPVPLPRVFVQGIDQQWEDFDKPRWAFLFGQWKSGGWWWYYLAALAVKMPIGWLLLLVGALRYVNRDSRLIAIGIGLPAFFIALVSTKTNMNEHTRYVWITLPMLAVLASSTVAYVSGIRWKLVCFAFVGWIVGAGLFTFPFGLSYANEWFGGPTRISRQLAGSNVDWCHGWVAAKKWLDANPNGERSIVMPTWYPLSVVGIETDIDNTSLWDASTSASDPIIVLVSIHDRMEIERRNSNAFLKARKIETLAYSVEVYEFPVNDRFLRSHGVKRVRDRQ